MLPHYNEEMIFYAFDGHNDVIKLYLNENKGVRKADPFGDQKADKFFVCDTPPDILKTDEEPDDSVEKESGLSLAAILAITLACILFLIIVVFLVHYFYRSGENSSEEKLAEGKKGEASSVKSTKVDKVKSMPVKSTIVMASKNSSSAKSPKGSSEVGKSKAVPSEVAKSKVTSDLGNKLADNKSSTASSNQAKNLSQAKGSSSKEK